MKRRTTTALFAAALAATSVVSTVNFSSAAGADTTEAARTRILGEGYDTPGVVRLKWVSITTWIASFGGHVVLFDSTVMDYLGKPTNDTEYITLEEVISLKPEFIFQNHVHLDQMRHASRIADATGAKIVGGQEHCNFVKRDAMVKGLNAPECILVVDSAGKPFTGLDSYASPTQPPVFTPYGTIGAPESETIPGVGVKVVNIKHTQIRPYPDSLEGSKGHVPDPSPYAEHPPTPGSAIDFALTQHDEGGNLLFLLDFEGFTVAHHGSSGSLDPLEPGQAEIRSALRSLGASDRVDVEISGIAELQNYANGLLDARRYAEEVGSKVFFPQHHGNWNPPATSDAFYYYEPWVEEMGKISEARRAELCFVTEAERATSYSFDASEWVGNDATGSITPVGGPDCYTG